MQSTLDTWINYTYDQYTILCYDPLIDIAQGLFSMQQQYRKPVSTNVNATAQSFVLKKKNNFVSLNLYFLS